MNLQKLLNDDKFNYIFSLLLGIGIICMIRPLCKGSECNVNKAPSDKDFDKYVYRMNGGKCYEFKSEIVECTSSETVEAFKECKNTSYTKENFNVAQFTRRDTPIKRCE
jgi:hypothetical protein